MTQRLKWTLLGLLAIAPIAFHYLFDKPLIEMAQLAGYWSSLILLYVTWSYVDATNTMLDHAETQADAAQEQAAISRAQIEAAQAGLQAAERDREERFKPVVVPITDFRTLGIKVGQNTFSGAPIAIQNIGNAAAVNISVTAEFLGNCATQPEQPFKLPSLAVGDAALLGNFTSIGNNTVPVVLASAIYRIQCSDIIGTKYEFECRERVLTQKRQST